MLGKCDHLSMCFGIFMSCESADIGKRLHGGDDAHFTKEETDTDRQDHLFVTTVVPWMGWVVHFTASELETFPSLR